MRWVPGLFLLLFSAPALAQVRTVVEPVAPSAESTEVFFLNEGDGPLDFEPPESVSAPRRGTPETLSLRAADRTRRTLPPGGFVKLLYVATDAGAEGAAIAEAAATQAAAMEAPASEEAGASPGGLLGRLEPHEPVYVIAGNGPDPTKVQFSFALRLFEGSGLLDGLRFAYTQTMFWGTDTPSWPFNSATYSPRGYYQLPLRRGGTPVDVAFGYAHDSNGRGGRVSRDVNRLFGRVSTRVPLTGEWTLKGAASAWTFVDWPAPTIQGLDDYWGNTALELALEEKRGLKLSAFLRGLETGRGALELNASYDLPELWRHLPRLHFFAQLFTGYGETLIAHTDHRTRLRLGVAFVR